MNHEGPKGALARYARWTADEGWMVVARERIGGKELAVVSVNYCGSFLLAKKDK